MPRYIIKVAPDRDLYLEWSTVVDAPVWYGTRAELVAHLSSPEMGSYWPRPEEIEARIARADATGSSGHPPFDEGAWDDEYLMVQQDGLLPRGKLTELADRIVAGGGEYEYGDLLEPFEDDSAENPDVTA